MACPLGGRSVSTTEGCFLSACLSQGDLPGERAGAIQTTTSTQTLFSNGTGTWLKKYINPAFSLWRDCVDSASCITETVSFTCSQARLLTLRSADDSGLVGFIIKPALLGHKWEEHWSCFSRRRGLFANSPLKAPSMNSTETGWVQYIYMLTFTFTK